MQKVFIDDGSTSVKMLWKGEDGEVHSVLSPNSFVAEFSAPYGDEPVYNYACEGVDYSFSPSSTDALKTTEVKWQYSAENAVAVQHALQISGLEPQPVHIFVTLPVTEFYDAKNQPDIVNIERKKSGYLRHVDVAGGLAFSIEQVTVAPESIPASFNYITNLTDDDSLLVIDIGGTTLDVALIQGRKARPSKIDGSRKIGVSLATYHLLDAMQSTKNKTTWTIAEKMLTARDDDKYLTGRLIHKDKLPLIKQAIADGIKGLESRVTGFISAFSGYTHVALVGGGASLVAHAVQKSTGMPDSNFFVSDNPQFDLVKGLMLVSR